MAFNRDLETPDGCHPCKSGAPPPCEQLGLVGCPLASAIPSTCNRTRFRSFGSFGPLFDQNLEGRLTRSSWHLLCALGPLFAAVPGRCLTHGLRSFGEDNRYAWALIHAGESYRPIWAGPEAASLVHVLVLWEAAAAERQVVQWLRQGQSSSQSMGQSPCLGSCDRPAWHAFSPLQSEEGLCHGLCFGRLPPALQLPWWVLKKDATLRSPATLLALGLALALPLDLVGTRLGREKLKTLRTNRKLFWAMQGQ